MAPSHRSSDQQTDAQAQRSSLGMRRAGGPVFGLGRAVQAEEEKEKTAPLRKETKLEARPTKVREEEQEMTVGPTPNGRGRGPSPGHTVYGRTSVRLQGRTDPYFDGGSFRTENEGVRRAQGCEGCSDGCVRVTGTLVATYRVTTTVTRPRVSDYPDLTPCQRERVRNAITNVLAPHEQEHVRAFERYNGTTRRRFDLTLCRSEFDGRIRQMFEAEEAVRRQAAQAASDALDPFYFDVDLDCADEEQDEAEQKDHEAGTVEE